MNPDRLHVFSGTASSSRWHCCCRRGRGAEDNSVAASQEVRIQQLEGQIRALNGQLEQMNFRVQQMTDKLDKLVADVDFRLPAARGRRRSGDGAGAGRRRQWHGREHGLLRPGAGNSRGSRAPAVTGIDPPPARCVGRPRHQPRRLGTLPQTPIRRAGSSSSTRMPTAARPQQRRWTAREGLRPTVAIRRRRSPAISAARRHGRRAVSVRLRSDAAEPSMTMPRRPSAPSSSEYPDHPLTGNASYWLGETYYVRERLQQCRASPSPRASRNIRRAARRRTPCSSSACRWPRWRDRGRLQGLHEVGKRYPKASDTLKERVAKERRRTAANGCARPRPRIPCAASGRPHPGRRRRIVGAMVIFRISRCRIRG